MHSAAPEVENFPGVHFRHVSSRGKRGKPVSYKPVSYFAPGPDHLPAGQSVQKAFPGERGSTGAYLPGEHGVQKRAPTVEGTGFQGVGAKDE